MGDIIIKNQSTGESYSITPTKEGYNKAQSIIDAIKNQGHKVSGDVGRVESFTGGSKY